VQSFQLSTKIIAIIFLFVASLFTKAYSQEPLKSIAINGDVVEYSLENKEVSATGNVEVIYKGSKLTCDKITINTETKDGKAEGHVKLEDEKSVIEGDKIIYNFNTKIGTIINSEFRSNPYYGRVRKVKKMGSGEFIALNGIASTCDYDKPHYWIRSNKMTIFPKQKILTEGNAFYIAGVPLLYLPRYNHNFDDTQTNIQLSFGKRKDWGGYLLSAWRHNFGEGITSRVYLDYRDELGISEGIGLNYTSPFFGGGDFKFYYTNEKPKDFPRDWPNPKDKFERYFVRWRHKWDIDERTNFVSEYYKIHDDKRKDMGPENNFLKTYFYREYEQDSEPLSYALFTHNFTNATFNILFQKLVNHWFNQLEKLPEVKYTMPTTKILKTPFYFEDQTSFVSYKKKTAFKFKSEDWDEDGEDDEEAEEQYTENRLDTYNELSLPTKIAFIEFTPYVANRETVYDEDLYKNSLPIRSIFYSGADLSTKFYRIFSLKSNLLGLNINDLRHVITPMIKYSFNREPTIYYRDLKRVDSIDGIRRNNSVALELLNELETKRDDKIIKLADLRLRTTYRNKPKAVNSRSKHGSGFSDFLVDLELLPYSWLRIDANATFQHSGFRVDPNYNRFSNINFDFHFNFGEERSLGVSTRYQRKGGKEALLNLNWRLNPKWKIGIYERFQYKDLPELDLERGLQEQQYTLSRDLHCWLIEFTYDIEKDQGHSFWVVFRLKAFPEIEFDFDQSVRQPKAGAQAN
jgi:lipopolysaccharide export system protein LptA